MHLIHLPPDLERVQTQGSTNGYGELAGEYEDFTPRDESVSWRTIAPDLDGAEDADDIGDIARHFGEV